MYDALEIFFTNLGVWKCGQTISYNFLLFLYMYLLNQNYATLR